MHQSFGPMRLYTKVFFAVALAFGLLWSALSASGSTHYVATTGNDSADGSLATPWLTINHAASASAANDTVLVEPGMYDEQVNVTRPGITFKADGTGVVLLGMFYILAASAYHPSYDGNATVIDGFEMRANSANAIYGAVAVDSGASASVTNCWIINNWIHDTKTWDCARGSIGAINFSREGTNVCFANGIVISNNVIANFGGFAIALDGFNCIAVNNWISNSYGADAFHIQGHNQIVRGNFCTQIGSGICDLSGASNAVFNGTYWYSASAVATNRFGTWYGSNGYCLVYSRETYVASGWSNAACLMSADRTHTYASADKICDTWTMHDSVMGTAFTNGMGAIEHPDWVESIGPLVDISAMDVGCVATNILLENNMIVNGVGGSPFMYGANWTNLPGPSIDWTFRNNVWMWTDVAGGVSTPYTKFYNNTFYQCSTNSPVSPLAFSFFATNSSDPRGMSFYSEVKSNAFVGCGNSPDFGWYAVASTGTWPGCPDVGGGLCVDPSAWPNVNVYTNCDYNYVGETDGSAKSSDAPNYPTTSSTKFSEPHGTNGGNVFVNLKERVYCFTNAEGTVFGAAPTNPYLARMVNMYSISATSPGGGAVVLDPPSGPYAENSTVLLTAVPDPGWTFLGWLGDSTGPDPTSHLWINRDKCVQAVFGTTIGTATVGNGSIALSHTAVLYPYGSVVRLTAIPQAGSYFVGWGGAAIGNDNPLDFTVTYHFPVIYSLFATLPGSQVALTAASDGNGEVTATPTGNSYPAGQQVTLTAVPDPGEAFLGWNGDATGFDNPLVVTLGQSTLITASFTHPPNLSVDLCAGGLRPEGFRLTLSGDLSGVYRFLVSTNLADWELLNTSTNVTGRLELTDPAATNSPARFYQAELIE